MNPFLYLNQEIRRDHSRQDKSLSLLDSDQSEYLDIDLTLSLLGTSEPQNVLYSQTGLFLEFLTNLN